MSESPMTDQELSEALDGLFAYDDGAVCSGISDPLLKERVRAELAIGRRENQLVSDRVTRIARELYMSDEAISHGYGIEAVAAFFQWLDDGMER